MPLYIDLASDKFQGLCASLLDLNHGAEIRIYEQLITPGGRLLAGLQAEVVVMENLNEDGIDLVDGEKASRTNLVVVAEVQDQVSTERSSHRFSSILIPRWSGQPGVSPPDQEACVVWRIGTRQRRLEQGSLLRRCAQG